MLFNSIQYILFLPIVAMLYFLIPSRFRWIGNIILSQEMDYQRVNYYLDITQPLDNGLYRYSVETFGNSDIAFTCVENGEELVHQEYSEKNYIDLPKLTKNQSLKFYLKPINVYEETVNKGKVSYIFWLR